MRGPLIFLFLIGIVPVLARGQDLRLDDQDLERFKDRSPTAGTNQEIDRGRLPEALSLSEETERYDQLIDRIKAQLRQVRIELRELPEQSARARVRLDSLRASEEELRRRAFERVVFRLPHPIYEDFEEALEEALERQSIRESLVEEIRANERAVEALEAERAALTRDLEQALRLKEEAREAAIGSR